MVVGWVLWKGRQLKSQKFQRSRLAKSSLRNFERWWANFENHVHWIHLQFWKVLIGPLACRGR